MTDPLITEADFDAVRAALDTNLNESTLPDDIIGQDIYAGAASREVIDRVADAASKTGDDANRVIAATVLLTAARLTTAVVRLTSLSVQTRDVTYSRPDFDPVKKAAELRALADAELSPLESSTTRRPNLFCRASGGRATI